MGEPISIEHQNKTKNRLTQLKSSFTRIETGGKKNNNLLKPFLFCPRSSLSRPLSDIFRMTRTFLKPLFESFFFFFSVENLFPFRGEEEA